MVHQWHCTVMACPNGNILLIQQCNTIKMVHTINRERDDACPFFWTNDPESWNSLPLLHCFSHKGLFMQMDILHSNALKIMYCGTAHDSLGKWRGSCLKLPGQKVPCRIFVRDRFDHVPAKEERGKGL